MSKHWMVIHRFANDGVVLNCRPGHVVGGLGLLYLAVELSLSSDFYSSKVRGLLMKNKGEFLARYQTYFIESFTAPFSLKSGWEEGIGRLNSCLAGPDRVALRLYRSFYRSVEKDAVLLGPTSVLGLALCPGLTGLMLGAYAYSTSRLRHRLAEVAGKEPLVEAKAKEFFDARLQEVRLQQGAKYGAAAMVALSLVKLVL